MSFSQQLVRLNLLVTFPSPALSLCREMQGAQPDSDNTTEPHSPGDDVHASARTAHGSGATGQLLEAPD